jgi:hypothetical protein
MAIIQKRLSGPTQVTTANTVAYTTPLSTTTIVKQIIMTNTTASAKTATIRLKPAGVAESNTLIMVIQQTLQTVISLLYLQIVTQP